MQKHEDWLKKSNRDLRSAKALLDIDILDTAIYHTQQCAEKALKAFLTYQRDPLRKSHDLEFLVKLCSIFDKNFDSILNEASELNPYCFQFRYPDDLFDPEKEDVILAIKHAEHIFKFVKDRILELQVGQENLFK